MAKPTKKQEEITEVQDVIRPSMEFEGHKNSFIEYVKKDDPELTAVGYARIPGTNTYASYVMKIKAGVVISMIVDEPNMKAVAEDSAKVCFVNELTREEEF